MDDKFLERQKAKRDDARRKKAQRARNDDHNDHSNGGSGTGENTKPETKWLSRHHLDQMLQTLRRSKLIQNSPTRER